MADHETRSHESYAARARTILESPVERHDFVKTLDALVNELAFRGDTGAAEAGADLASVLEEMPS